MKHLSDIIEIAEQAGEILLSHFHSGFAPKITLKSDQSPVTQADFAANHFITERLIALDPSIPILSEENTIPDFSIREQWKKYWLIDPLDGTRGFIARNPEFCVNIALIENHVATLGVIYSPVEKICYYASKDNGAYRINNEGLCVSMYTHSRHEGAPLRCLCGHSDRVIKEPLYANMRKMNSALKFGVIAGGDADLYVRFGETCEWDTAAGQCIVEAAGGAVVDFQGQPLQYNAKASLINASFIVMGDVTKMNELTTAFGSAHDSGCDS